MANCLFLISSRSLTFRSLTSKREILTYDCKFRRWIIDNNTKSSKITSNHLDKTLNLKEYRQIKFFFYCKPIFFLVHAYQRIFLICFISRNSFFFRKIQLMCLFKAVAVLFFGINIDIHIFIRTWGFWIIFHTPKFTDLQKTRFFYFLHSLFFLPFFS